MKQLVGVCVLFAVSWAGAEVLTVDSILAAHRMGAPADGIVATVNDPANTVGLTSADLATLRTAGVPESVIAALQARIPAATPAPAPAQPDDVRLVDLVKVLKSGLSESLLAEQLKQSGQAYNLSVNDLLFLKENGVPEAIIATLMATAAPGPGAALASPGTPVAVAEPVVPAEVVFDGLVLQKATFLKRNRPGKLVLKGETLAWVDGKDPRESFEIQVGGAREGLGHLPGQVPRELLLPGQPRDREGRPPQVPGHGAQRGIERRGSQADGRAAHPLSAASVRPSRGRQLTLGPRTRPLCLSQRYPGLAPEWPPVPSDPTSPGPSAWRERTVT